MQEGDGLCWVVLRSGEAADQTAERGDKHAGKARERQLMHAGTPSGMDY
jgi:hypothetical protein